jgi:hypothetical protein
VLLVDCTASTGTVVRAMPQGDSPIHTAMAMCVGVRVNPEPVLASTL